MRLRVVGEEDRERRTWKVGRREVVPVVRVGTQFSNVSSSTASFLPFPSLQGTFPSMATDEQWEEFPIELHRYERYWMLQYDVLHRRGYILRERYKPTEVDDWLNGTIEVDPDEAERRGLLDFPVRLYRLNPSVLLRGVYISTTRGLSRGALTRPGQATAPKSGSSVSSLAVSRILHSALSSS